MVGFHLSHHLIFLLLDIFIEIQRIFYVYLNHGDEFVTGHYIIIHHNSIPSLPSPQLFISDGEFSNRWPIFKDLNEKWYILEN